MLRAIERGIGESIGVRSGELGGDSAFPMRRLRMMRRMRKTMPIKRAMDPTVTVSFILPLEQAQLTTNSDSTDNDSGFACLHLVLGSCNSSAIYGVTINICSARKSSCIGASGSSPKICDSSSWKAVSFLSE